MYRKRQAVLLSVAMLTAGCAGGSVASSPYSVVTGRIISTTNLARFIGDVAEEAYSYAVEPENTPGTRLAVIGGNENECAKTAFNDQVYVITLERRQMAFGLSNDGQRALISDQAIVSCAPKAPP